MGEKTYFTYVSAIYITVWLFTQGQEEQRNTYQEVGSMLPREDFDHLEDRIPKHASTATVKWIVNEKVSGVTNDIRLRYKFVLQSQ